MQNLQEINAIVGERIKRLRMDRGESQEELATAIGRTQNNISKIESGAIALTLENQFIIAEHYHVSHDYICLGKEDLTTLDLLKKYVSLEYKKISQSNETLICPILHINKVLFDYLFESARMNSQKLSKTVRETWKAESENAFYIKNQQDSDNETVEIVPLLEQLIYPDSNKDEWKQRDLLRELNRQLVDSIDYQ